MSGAWNIKYQLNCNCVGDIDQMTAAETEATVANLNMVHECCGTNKNTAKL